ncbi:MAG TPA: HAD-IC family P-type ATPase [Gaiellaceae bacterium]|nr:HAD-IC family P-type ATPase [Gaiellaceae bacterium]
MTHDASIGLSSAEAARRLAERGPLQKQQSSRSYASIVRANVLTVFNLILAVLGVLTLVYGDWRDALFLVLLLANSGIGILQEVRAKRALDRLAALVEPTATVVRDGAPQTVDADEVVVGDVLEIKAGDSVVADGRLVRATDLRLDESVLTGESQPVSRPAGEEVRSGSFAVEGSGRYEVTAVSEESWAGRLAGEAQAFRHPRSPLELAVNRLLLVLVCVMVPLGIMLGYALWKRDTPADEAIETSVAGVVSIVPEGLVLLMSLTYAVATLRTTRRGALAQQLNAIESLASIDTICLDKTGTLTEGSLRVARVVPADGRPSAELEGALGRYAASATLRNATLEALAESFAGEPEPPAGEVPFASRRRWSGLRLGETTYVLGAPEVVGVGLLGGVAAAEAASGRRVVAFAEASEPLPDEDGAGPPVASVLGLVVLAERLRPEARSTVEFFHAQGVELKVVSGDAPATVAAIAEDVGISAGDPVDGRELPESREELRRLVLGSSVIGRVEPETKRVIVEELRLAGRNVAMVGDGVNDVPALKAARLAIAQGSGVQMARAVADLVLVRGDFGAVPAMVAEGRTIFRNVRRVSKLFVAKSAFAAVLILSIGVTPTAYPLLPRHLTLAAAITIGIPAFILALAPSSGPFGSRGFLRDVARFAVPGGTAAALGVVASYLAAFYVFGLSLVESRTVATTVLIVVGLYLVVVLEAGSERRLRAVLSLCLALLALFFVVMSVAPSRDFFELAEPDPLLFFLAAVGAALPIAGLCATDDRFVPRPRGEDALA